MRVGGVLCEPIETSPHMSWHALWEDATKAEWFVLHVKSRHEKALAEELAFTGIDYYLPLVGQARYYGKRKAFVQMPLFPGYLFLRGTIEDAYRANSGKRVARILKVCDQQQLDGELENLHTALSQRIRLDPYPFLRAGIRVEVRAGPLRGLRGWVQDRTRRNRLILQVEMLGKAASLEIDGALLDPLE
jgi:transcriptional antiterminator NusG